MKNTPIGTWDPEHYKKYAKQTERGLVIAESLPFYGNERVLDVGCGDGRISAAIAQRLPKGSAVGLDISEHMIATAQKTYASAKNLSFICQDITTYCSPNTFDMVVSFAAFHWVEEQSRALKKIHDALRMGGRLFIAMSARDEGPVPQLLASDRWCPLVKRQKETYFGRTVEELVGLLEQAGFDGVIVQCKKVETVFKSEQEFLNQTLTWVPYATGLSDENAHAFAQDVVDRNVQRHGGRLVNTTSSLYAQATRRD